jgi:hypothetical protein
VYLYLTEEAGGLFVFKDKITGLWYVVPVALDYEYTERLLRRAEAIRDHVAAGALPERIPDRSECASCPFADTVCLPDDTVPDQVMIADDPHLVEQLEQWNAGRLGAKVWERLDKGLKERFKRTSGQLFIAGDYMIEKRKHGKGVRVVITKEAQHDG